MSLSHASAPSELSGSLHLTDALSTEQDDDLGSPTNDSFTPAVRLRGHGDVGRADERQDQPESPYYIQSNTLTNSSEHPAALGSISSFPTPAAGMSKWSNRERGGLSKPVIDHLKHWLLSHFDHPYPSEDEGKQLCHATGLSMDDVSSWISNVCKLLFCLVPSGGFTFFHRPGVGLSLVPNLCRMQLVSPVHFRRHQPRIHLAQSSSTNPICRLSDLMSWLPRVKPRYCHNIITNKLCRASPRYTVS